MKDIGVECQRSILNAHHSGALSGWTMNQSASMIDKTLQYLLAAEPFTLINLTNVIPFSPMNFIRGQSVIHVVKTHRNWSKVTRANLLPQLCYELLQWLELSCGFMHMTSTALKDPRYEKFTLTIFSHINDEPLACQWTLQKSTYIPSLLFSFSTVQKVCVKTHGSGNLPFVMSLWILRPFPSNHSWVFIPLFKSCQGPFQPPCLFVPFQTYGQCLAFFCWRLWTDCLTCFICIYIFIQIYYITNLILDV